MKCKRLLSLVFAVFVTLGLVLVLGCTNPPKPVPPPPPPEEEPLPPPPPPPPPPLSSFTVGILNRLVNETENFNINQCQFFLSSKITLEDIEVGNQTRVVDGVVVFTDSTSKKEIAINDRTEGEAIRMSRSRNGIELFLSFDENEINQLQFSATGAGENALFFLSFTPLNDPSIDARGKLSYGGRNYNLKFSGVTPHLMIRLTEKRDPVRELREAPGRKIASAGAATLEPPQALTTEIMERLKRTPDYNIGQYQFYLSGAITLEGIDNPKKVSVNSSGEVIFEERPTTRVITIKDKTAGLAVKIDEADNLYICFEQEDRYQLVFSPSKADSQFYLKTNPPRGSWPYGGGNDYNIRFSGGVPSLQISVRNEGGNTTDQRTAPGRRVGR
jgi:hypothetical protein